MIKKFGLLLLFCASIIIIIAIIFVDISNDPNPKLVYPFSYQPMKLESAPIEVSCDELYNEYLNDEKAADKKYKNKRLLFSNMEVTDITTYNTLSGGELLPFISCFSSNDIKFQLSNPYIMQSVEVGYILNLVGDCRGLSQDHIFIWDCWAESVSGDLESVEGFKYGY